MTKQSNDYAAAAAVLIGYLGLLATGVAFLGECLYWLKMGTWPEWTLARFSGLPAGSTGYLGLDKILRWYFDLYIASAIFWGAALVCGFLLLINLMEEAR